MAQKHYQTDKFFCFFCLKKRKILYLQHPKIKNTMIAKFYYKNIAHYGVVSGNAPMLCFLGIGHLRCAFFYS